MYVMQPALRWYRETTIKANSNYTSVLTLMLALVLLWLLIFSISIYTNV